jgi:ABC-2 type transport system permease protein
MKNSLSEEYFKFKHQNIPLYSIVILLLLLIYTGVSTTKVSSKLIAMGFGTIQWVPIIIIAVGSAFFAMEYNNNTILIMLYKSSNRFKIYMAKFGVMALFETVLVVIGTLFTFVLKMVLTGNEYRWSAIFMGHSTLLTALLLNMFGTILYCLFMVALSFALIMWIKINAAVIGIGLAIGFMGSSISASLMEGAPGLIGITKWNPLNFIFICNQLSMPKFIHYSHLTNGQLILGTVVYTLLFMFIGYRLFKKRRV